MRDYPVRTAAAPGLPWAPPLFAPESSCLLTALFGTRTIINGRGTYTYLSGFVVMPVVCDAMRAASFNYVNLFDLHAAAGIPLFENFSRFAKLGVDMYSFSGGNAMCGPQDSGILLGRKDLTEPARYNCAPWEGSICRPMKVGKEEIMGVIAAVDYWSNADPVAGNTF